MPDAHAHRRDAEYEPHVHARGDWIRPITVAILVVALGAALGALGFVVALSNRMTALEVKEDVAQHQRAELAENLRDLTLQVSKLKETIIVLNQRLEFSIVTIPHK